MPAAEPTATILVIAYRMQATILNTTRPSLVAAKLPWWPPDGVGPDGATSPPDA